MRTIEIIFWGLALFVPQQGSYLVLIPDGSNAQTIGVPSHLPAIQILPASAQPVEKWSWAKNIAQNKFSIEQPCRTLKITGLSPTVTPADDSNFDDRLPNVKDSDPNFQLSPSRQSMAEMAITHGVLTAHGYPSGMVLAKWTVTAPEDGAVTLDCAGNTLVLAKGTQKVVLENYAHSPNPNSNHYRLYRVLSTDPTGSLAFTKPKKPPLAPLQKVFTPRVDCSGALMKEPVRIRKAKE